MSFAVKHPAPQDSNSVDGEIVLKLLRKVDEMPHILYDAFASLTSYV